MYTLYDVFIQLLMIFDDCIRLVVQNCQWLKFQMLVVQKAFDVIFLSSIEIHA